MNVNRLLSAFTNRVQDVENAAWDVLQKRLLDGNASGVVLDWYGKLVNFPRGALTDADYLPALKIQIMVLRSTGRAEDIIRIATALATLMGSAPAGYLEGYPGGLPRGGLEHHVPSGGRGVLSRRAPAGREGDPPLFELAGVRRRPFPKSTWI